MINSVPIYKLSGVTQYTVMGNLTGQPAGPYQLQVAFQQSISAIIAEEDRLRRAYQTVKKLTGGQYKHDTL
jgi:hypothetical protein